MDDKIMVMLCVICLIGGVVVGGAAGYVKGVADFTQATLPSISSLTEQHLFVFNEYVDCKRQQVQDVNFLISLKEYKNLLDTLE